MGDIRGVTETSTDPRSKTPAPSTSIFSAELNLIRVQYHESSKTADYWHFQWQRAQQTWFQPAYMEKCRKMGEQIDQIKQRVITCDQRREREMRSNTDSFKSIWLTTFKNATNLYNLLKTAWRCRCHLTHKTFLNLRSLIAESSRQREKDINLIFALSSSSPIGMSILFGGDK